MFKTTTALSLFVRKTLLFLGFMTICRIIFLLFNINYFNSVGFSEFFHGFRFDFVTAVYGLFPFYVALTFLFKFLDNRVFVRIINAYFAIATILFIALNCIDVIYFKFTFKRMTWDIFNLVATGDDVLGLIPQFIADYWYIILIFLLLSYSVIRLNRLGNTACKEQSLKLNALYSMLIITGLVFAARGGFQLKPLGIIDASRYTEGQNVPLVLSTPFTLMKTFSSEKLKKSHYFEDEAEALNYFNPVLNIQSDSQGVRKNLVVIIMESFSREYIGFYNNGKGYTAFLDSIMGHSIVFNHAFANGKRSIEALPAIFSALPNLMNEAYSTSPYSGNRIESLASILGKKGYNTHFFHGGKNGTMGFDSYAKLAGFDFYYGLNEYENKNDFDGSWGIYDIPYFQYLASEQDKLREPFMTAIFSLSAHHPYKLPSGYTSDCPEGKLPIHPTICYSDDALRKYFGRVKNTDWYKNTLFIITADHTAQSINKKYNTSKGIYAIPLIFFDPSSSHHKLIENTVQQADITPSALDYLGLPTRMISFGKSAFDPAQEGLAVNYLSGLYQLIENEHTILFDGEQVVSAFEHNQNGLDVKPILKPSDPLRKSEKKLKAIIQEYNQRMIDNKLTVDE